MNIEIPVAPARAMEVLEAQGHEAYVVGGCVRDALLGRIPSDWDICTSALPEETLACFQAFRVIETGLRHGTVTVLMDGETVEVTTYRVDGAYSDHRHPDNVRFVSNLRADLARRDFTINAMAAGRTGEVVDFYGGWTDLTAGLIRCVGEPARRLEEDALRIMRALRFASVYGFALEERTAEAVHAARGLLTHVAVERVSAELSKLLLGRGVGDVLCAFPDVLVVFLPELKSVAGDSRQTSNHLDLWGHTALAVGRGTEDLIVRLSLLLCNAVRPQCCTADVGGVEQFAAPSAHLAEACLTRLRFNGETTRRVRELIEYYNVELLPEARSVRWLLSRLGERQLRRLLAIWRADVTAQAQAEFRAASLNETERCLDRVIAEGQCVSLGELAVKGGDLLAMGVPPGKTVGETLRGLLELVLDGKMENNRETLLSYLHDNCGNSVQSST